MNPSDHAETAQAEIATIAVTASSIPATALHPTLTASETTTSKVPEVTLKVITTVTVHEAVQTVAPTPSTGTKSGDNTHTKRSDETAVLEEAIDQVLDNPRCLTALRWPLETLRNTKREDIVFLNFHFWVLGMSIVAILNESLVHMIATLVTHALLTAWSTFQIISTRDFQIDFNRIITHNACPGPSLLPDYWKQRTSVEIPAAVLNGVALLLSAFLTWRLVVTYNWATFKRIGASRSVSKAYKMVLTFSVALQLSLFFIVVSMALWIDQLMNGAIGVFAILSNVYTGVYITVLILLVPWIIVGWRAVRIEHRIFMAGFLAFDVLLVGGWASMFASTTFRLTFMQWRFFAVMSVVALLLTISCLVFGVMCRMNFGNDLKRHLNGQENLPDGFVSAIHDDDRSSMYSYEEKVAFPETSLPSFTMSRVPTNSSVQSQSSYQSSPISTNSGKSEASISGPMILPTSRFSIDSSDGGKGDVDNSGHQINESGQSKSSRRWIIE